MKAATEAGHPKHALARVSDLLSSTLREVFLGDPFKVRARRAAFLKKWMKRALELRTEEKELHAKLPEHLQHLLTGKKLRLWKEILDDLGYPDSKIVDEICRGFPVTAWAEQSGVFQTQVRPPSTSFKQLEGSWHSSKKMKALFPKQANFC